MESDQQITLLALEFLCGKNKKLCRLCLSSVNSQDGAVALKNIVQVQTPYCKDTMSLNTVLAKLGIPDEPLLPQVLCSDCSTILINSYLFQQLTEFSNKKWDIILKVLGDTFSKSAKLDLKKMKSAFAIVDKTEMFTSHQSCTAKTKQRTVANVNKIMKTYNKKITIIKNELVCEECGKTFETYFLLTKHKMVFHKKARHPCPDCSKVFNMQTYLDIHAERVHYPKKLKCRKCPKKFSTIRLLKHHMRIEHIPVNCEDCNIELPSKAALKFHLEHHIINTCPYCNKGYSNIKYFKLHKKYCGNRNQHAYICDICQKVYQAKNGLKSHMIRAHGFGKVLSCEWCNKKFDVSSRLNDHIVKHTKEKRFYCEKCGGKFVTHKSLINHIRLHTGERPYPCDLCDGSFLSASRRLEHKKRKHFEPAHKCSLCEAKFVTRYEWRKHLNRHFKQSSKLYITGSDILPTKLVIYPK